jgi:hypothetical protein
MLVPNAENAVVEIEKLTEYCLNPIHEIGGDKARVFRSALGLTVEDVNELRDGLKDAIKQVGASEGVLNQFGQRYIVDFEMVRGLQRATIRSVWIIGPGKNYPRLITCYVI